MTAINCVWLTDFTYIPVLDDFRYLCVVEDLCLRRIVGWATSQQIDTKLALAALDQAIAVRHLPAGLIVHSDRGSQFASLAYRQRLEKHSFRQSMSRKENCYDNAPKESFYRSFKVEEVHHKKFQSHEHATRTVVDYIERFYNRKSNAFGTRLLESDRIRKSTPGVEMNPLSPAFVGAIRRSLAPKGDRRMAQMHVGHPAFVGGFRESDRSRSSGELYSLISTDSLATFLGGRIT